MSFDPQENTHTPDVSGSVQLTFSCVAPTKPPALRSVRPLTGELKTCTTCAKEQDLREFAIKNNSRALRCRACQKVLSDRHYQLNKAQRIADAAVRNTRARHSLTQRRDAYLAQCVCEACSSTVGLRLTTVGGYDGLAMHEVVAASGSNKLFEEALKNSEVLCGYCMGHKYGKQGGLAKAASRVSDVLSA